MANEIDFNPRPSYGSNPFEPIVEGLNLGLGLQRAIIETKEIQRKEKEAQEQKQILEAEKRNKNFQEGLGLMKDRKFIEAFPTEIKNDVLRNKIVPYLKNDLKVDVPDDISFSDVQSALDQGIKILESNASQDMKRQAFASLMLRASEDEAPRIKSAAEMAIKKHGISRQTGKVTDSGLPIYWSPESEEFSYTDPTTGESVPYRGVQYPPMQNPSVSAETQMREVFSQKSLLDESIKNLTPDKVGLIDKKFKTVGAYVDNSTDPEAIYFRSITELANTVIRNNFYGATLTPNELRAFSEIAANRNLSPKAFSAQVKAMKFSFDRIEDSIRKAAALSNRPFRDNAGSELTTKPIVVNSQAEYDRLKPGTRYVDSEGNEAVKK